MREQREPAASVVLALRHQALADGIRGLLATVSQRVCIVADAASLAGASGLKPDLVASELAFAAGDVGAFVRRMRDCVPGAKLLLLGDRDHLVVVSAITAAGADGFVAKRVIATELLPVIDALLAGRHAVADSASEPCGHRS